MPNPDGAELCGHGRRVCAECVVITDAARRALDQVNIHVWAITDWTHRVRGWVALRLADGGSDGVFYESRRDAVRHQSDERLCAFFSYRNAPNGFASLKDAQLFMDYHRMAYDQGALQALADPDHPQGGQELIIPTTSEMLMLQRAALMAGRN